VIRGPQSALTDFLASHNISARQIRDDYEQRRRDADQTGADAADATEQQNGNEAVPEEEEEPSETEEQKKKRKRKESAAIAKIKKSKAFQQRKRALAGEPGDDDDDELAFDMYAKSKPAPGQLDNCEICEKRFTVTPYTKTGPNGGLLCTKCGKAQEDAKKKDAKAKKAPVSRDKRRKVQSNLLDGLVPHGAKSLLELCIEVSLIACSLVTSLTDHHEQRVADSINDVDEFGDLPPNLLDRLSQILSRRRVLNSRTIDLFLRPELNTVSIYDCGKLETEDFNKIFAFAPKVERLDLRYAGQMKDSVIDYILERNVPLREVRLDSTNLISDAKWREFFIKMGSDLESLQLSWLDFAMDNETVAIMAKNCINLRRLKLKRCFHLGDEALTHLAALQKLEHLSLAFVTPVNTENLTNLVGAVGHNLHTLSLRRFQDVDDDLLRTIHSTCTKLKKLAITYNDRVSDAGFYSLFTNWQNPSLVTANFSSTRDTDSGDLDESTDVIGLASNGFKALMSHSGSTLEKLNISSCRHISSQALLEVFDGEKQYPALKDIDLSFIFSVDTTIVAGLFRSCPSLKKIAAFGCFDVAGIVVPAGVALIGVPSAQDSIVQEGTFDSMEF
jgi:DNA repair protein RAD7